MDFNLKGLIFDFDNTLVKSHIDFPAMKISMAQFTKQHGLEFGLEEEIPNKYTAGNIIDAADEFDRRNGTLLVPQLWSIVEEFESKGMENLSIDKEVFSLLNLLKEKNISIALLTNNSREPTLQVLKEYNLYDYFSVIIAREDVFRMKPDKEGICLILQKMNLKINEVALVGDSWVDGRAAINASIRFILFREELLDTEKYGIEIWQFFSKMEDLIAFINDGIFY
ncbi:MAG: HAD family hydrolase [Candidatus Thorarchaeota archaeon]